MYYTCVRSDHAFYFEPSEETEYKTFVKSFFYIGKSSMFIVRRIQNMIGFTIFEDYF